MEENEKLALERILEHVNNYLDGVLTPEDAISAVVVTLDDLRLLQKEK